MMYDIFISYRHNYTADKAEHLLTLLENNGFRGRVSFDKDNLNSRFDIEILRRVDNCTDFIIVLGEKTFDNISFDDTDKYLQLAKCKIEEFEVLQNQLFPLSSLDYTRLELARAIVHGKNIVPIAPLKNPTYSFDALVLPQDIKILTKYQATFYDDAGSMTFQDVVERKVLGKKTLLKSLPDKRPYDYTSVIKMSGYVAVFAVLTFVVYIFQNDYREYQKCRYTSQYQEYLSADHIFYNKNIREKQARLDQLLKFEGIPDELRHRIINDLTSINVEQAYSLTSILKNMVFVESGEFMMGADTVVNCIRDYDISIQEAPAHLEHVDDFYMSLFELSVEEWNGIIGISNDNLSVDERTMPITNVSWEEVQTFIALLNELTGIGFRLPYEKEWEYAAKGGNKSKGYKYSGSNNPREVAWLESDSLSQPQYRYREGISWWKDSNELGLFNMGGNVAELCQDDYNLYYDPERTYEGYKIVKGGSYDLPARQSRITARDRIKSSGRNNTVGFRLIIDLSL